jgi:hypothetical protein
MKFINKILYFMSKTDKDIIKCCSHATRSSRAALGLFVLITAIFAFISGTYAISTIFREVNETTGESVISAGGLIISLMAGLLYALLIGNIDREIVSSPSRYAALIRFPLAIILGIVLAYPLELKLMESRITNHLISLNESKNSYSRERKDEQLKALALQEVALVKKIQDEKDEVVEWSKKMHYELGGIRKVGYSGIEGDGPMYKDAKRNMQLHQENVRAAEKELETFRAIYNSKVEIINKDYEFSHRSQSFDFLSRMEALSDLKKKSKGVNTTAWGILLVLIILELTPALLKLVTTFEKKSEYDFLMEGRLAINSASVSVYANNAINEIEKDVNKTNYNYMVNLKNIVRV